MLITLTQLKKSLQALKDFLLAKIPLKTSDLTNDSGYITADDETVKDVQINGTSILEEGVANIPVANDNNIGLLGVDTNRGLALSTTGKVSLLNAKSDDIKIGTEAWKSITPVRQHESTFYGLAKAAGDTTQSASDNPVGTYTDDAKASIKTMLGVEDPVDVQINGTSIVDNGVANIPVAGGSTLGVVKAETQYGLDPTQSGLRIYYAHEGVIKVASGSGSLYQPIVPAKQHQSVFYGLAKAAGDTTQSASSNAVGTYTDEAKTAIKTMLGIDMITVDSIPTTEIDTLFA